MATLERAIAFAAQAHEGQVDKAGAPYILHPLRVMLAMAPDDDHRIAGVLHDVVEDTRWTLAALDAEGFSGTVLDAVEAVTRRDGETYMAYVERAAKNSIGRLVKIADLKDNSDISRIHNPTDDDWKRQLRYGKALTYLYSLG